MPSQFSRHLELIGPGGLERLGASIVAVIGAGGLGSTVLELLTRSGVGTLQVYDSGVVDLPDLNRQLLYTHADLGKQKASAAAARLSAINPELVVFASAVRVAEGFSFTAPNSETDAETDAGIGSVPRPPDVVVDCLDNFSTRFVVDEATYAPGVPMVHGGVYRYFGQVTTVRKDLTPSLRDIFGQEQTGLDAETQKPMFPPAVVGVATIQATECLKLLLLRPPEELLFNRILSIDYTDYSFREIPLST